MLSAARPLAAAPRGSTVARANATSASVGGRAVPRPLRRGACAWGARPRFSPRRPPVAASARDADADGEADVPSPRGEAAAEPDAPRPADFGRARSRFEGESESSRRRPFATSDPPAEASSARTPPPPAPRLPRAGHAAIVAAAAMFGAAGVAHAAAAANASASSPGSAPAAAAAAAAVAPAAEDVVGANDLGILLADADGDQSAEDAARARKLAEVRRLKAERKKALQKRKADAASDSAGGETEKDSAPKDLSDVAAQRERMLAEREAAKKGGKKLTPAEEKKAARIAAAKEKAFQEALARERAAKAEEAGAALEEDAGDALDAAPLVAAVAAPEDSAAEEASKASKASSKASKAKKASASSSKKKASSGDEGKKPFGLELPGGLRLGGGGSKAPVSRANSPIAPGEKKGFFSNLIGPRFVRNVNLRYLKDPHSVKGTTTYPCETSYTGFYELCEVGRVTRVEYMPNMNSVKFFLRDTDEVFYANLPYDPTLFKMMLQKKIDIVSRQYTPFELFIRSAFNALTPAVLVYFCWCLWMDMSNDPSEGSTLMNTGTTKTYNSKAMTGMTMKDIAGIDVVREEMDELISYLKDYRKYDAAGAVIPSGVLLCGPPGTGKTLLARCLAGEANVPFFSVAGTEFMEMFVGVGASRIRNLFKQARDVKPCIVFIDEFDSVAVRRADPASQDIQGNDEQVATINQLLTELDGFGGNSGIMVFAATNRPHVIDPALIRPGRFDRVVEMPLPNRAARCDIIDLHCSYAQYAGMIDPDLNIPFIARQAAGFTGADLENMVRTAALRNNSTRERRGVPADTNVFLTVIDEIRRSNVFKATGAGTVGETDEVTENALIQQMNPYVRDTICTYFAAQCLVAMMVPNFDDVAKVRVFAAGEETGQIVYVPDEVGVEGAAAVKRRAWYESKISVLVAGQMAERYLYGPDKVSQFGVLDMREATAMACEMVMMHGWSDLGPLVVLQDMSREEKYLKSGKQKGQSKMENERARGKMWGMPAGKNVPLAEVRRKKGMIESEAQMFMLGVSDELDLLIANEVRKIFIRACQRAVMIMHEPKGTEMLFTLREALATAKEVNGLNLRAVFKKFGLEKPRDFTALDLDWGKNDDVYWDEFVNHIWAADPDSTGFWRLVQEQWQATVQDPTRSIRGVDPVTGEPRGREIPGGGDAAREVAAAEMEPNLPEWAREYVFSLEPAAQEEMLQYAPKEVRERIRAGKPKLYDGPEFARFDEDGAEKAEKDA